MIYPVFSTLLLSNPLLVNNFETKSDKVEKTDLMCTNLRYFSKNHEEF